LKTFVQYISNCYIRGIENSFRLRSQSQLQTIFKYYEHKDFVAAIVVATLTIFLES